MSLLQIPTAGDIHALLALNNAHEREVGLSGRSGFAELIAMSFRTRMTDDRDAFLIALAGKAPEIAPNYRWFVERYGAFVYIDRVVVAEQARRKGYGRLLYRDLLLAAVDAGYRLVCCEINSDPPNPVSDAFHASFGFEEVGRAFLPDRGKSVRYLTLNI
jgi:predicted GNAT superfamily acetyltransferase